MDAVDRRKRTHQQGDNHQNNVHQVKHSQLLEQPQQQQQHHRQQHQQQPAWWASSSFCSRSSPSTSPPPSLVLSAGEWQSVLAELFHEADGQTLGVLIKEKTTAATVHSRGTREQTSYRGDGSRSRHPFWGTGGVGVGGARVDSGVVGPARPLQALANGDGGGGGIGWQGRRLGKVRGRRRGRSEESVPLHVLLQVSSTSSPTGEWAGIVCRGISTHTRTPSLFTQGATLRGLTVFHSATSLDVHGLPSRSRILRS